MIKLIFPNFPNFPLIKISPTYLLDNKLDLNDTYYDYVCNMTVRKGYEYLNGYELIQKCQVGSPSPKPASSLASNQTSITHSPNTVVATHDTRTKNANRSLMAVNKDFKTV